MASPPLTPPLGSAQVAGTREPGKSVISHATDDFLDDNADDSCLPNYVAYAAIRDLSPLVTDSACSWQCGGQGFESP
jgi:hypothetical protein